MKKILFTVMAVAAIGFTSCGNKAGQQAAEAEAVDSVAIVDSIASGVAQETITALSSNLEAGDASKLESTLKDIKSSVAVLIKDNPKVAKEYIVKVQNFLKENADKVKTLVGDNAAVNAALAAVTNIDPANVVNGLLEQVGEAATDAKDAAVDAANEKVDEAKQAAEDKANEVKDAVKQKIEDEKAAAKQKAGEAVDNAAAAAKSKLGL